MSTHTLNPTAIRKAGIETLAKKLGPVGMVRFLQQYEVGIGDYTREREKLQKGLNVKGIVRGDGCGVRSCFLQNRPCPACIHMHTSRLHQNSPLFQQYYTLTIDIIIDTIIIWLIWLRS